MSAKRTSGTTLDPALRFVAEAPPDADSPAAKPAGRRWELGSRQWRGFLFAIAALAFLVRLIPVLRGGGLTFYGRYDDGVYYAAADALTFGRVPYRDFVLLHPPVIMLAVAPFAALGRITSDQVGMATARVAFMAIGALNATLVARLARRWGLVAAVVAGIIYVGWLPAVFAEQTVLMEPIGGAAILVALLLLVKRPTLVTARAEWLAGGALGFAAVTKIWYLAPWALLVLWPLLQRRLGSALRILGGGVIVAAIIVAPFAVLARGRMWDMVIRDQLLRPAGTVPRLGRLADVAGASLIHHSPARWVLAIVVLVLIAACATLSAKDRSARLITALFVVDLLVLLASPSYFLH
ncbi:MAG TPA: glycosyltransferase 87 family protein, partial [Mycobacteriales bacterium]|nr:glycosyltransferase 87 family protein [Mycobacteriales bacterium]